MFGKQEVKAFLDEKGLQYEWIEHEAVYTIEDMVRLGLEENKDVAKNLFLRDQKGKRHFLVVIRADKQANLKELGEKLGIGKLSFASEERFNYVKRGVAERWIDLNGRWAVPGNGYGESIIDDYWMPAVEDTLPDIE